MNETVSRVISPREMIGLAELCDGAGDRSFALLMVECAFAALSADCHSLTNGDASPPAIDPRCRTCPVMGERHG